MSAVRNVLTDLVDRRLWPVALALVAALVAVPVMLGGSKASTAAPADPIAAAPATGATAQAAISVSTPEATPRERAGRVHNPFAQHQVPTPPDHTVNVQSQTTAPPSIGSAPSVDIGNVNIGGGLPTTPVVPGSGGGRRDATVTDVWRVNLRFGEAGSQKLRHDVPRLTPLPSATNPFFIFMGIMSDHKTAVFLISSDATATGDGTCKPDPTQCDTIEMKAGDTEFFDVAEGNAGIVQYELDLIKVFNGKVKGKAAAARAARRVSKGGKTVVHELKAEGDQSMGRYIYSYKRGVLVRRHARRATASASSMSTGVMEAAHTSSLAGTTWGP
jgi:hypothetical protein